MLFSKCSTHSRDTVLVFRWLTTKGKSWQRYDNYERYDNLNGRSDASRSEWSVGLDGLRRTNG